MSDHGPPTPPSRLTASKCAALGGRAGPVPARFAHRFVARVKARERRWSFRSGHNGSSVVLVARYCCGDRDRPAATPSARTAAHRLRRAHRSRSRSGPAMADPAVRRAAAAGRSRRPSGHSRLVLALEAAAGCGRGIRPSRRRRRHRPAVDSVRGRASPRCNADGSSVPANERINQRQPALQLRPMIGFGVECVRGTGAGSARGRQTRRADFAACDGQLSPRIASARAAARALV